MHSPRTGFIFRRIKSLFHHSNWQHIFLISFNGTSKRGVMHYNKKNKKIIWFFGQTLPICMRNSGISIIKSVANLKISWSFFIRKILRSTRTLDCDKYRLKSKGKFFSFCWAIFLYFSTPISWVMSYDKKCPRFVDPVRGWVKLIIVNQDVSIENLYISCGSAKKITDFIMPHWIFRWRQKVSMKLVYINVFLSTLGSSTRTLPSILKVLGKSVGG